MNEQELKEKIKSLYEELIEEKNGFYLPGSGYRTKEPPSGLRYAVKALELLDVAKKNWLVLIRLSIIRWNCK